jgi:hypothetical protein
MREKARREKMKEWKICGICGKKSFCFCHSSNFNTKTIQVRHLTSSSSCIEALRPPRGLTVGQKCQYCGQKITLEVILFKYSQKPVSFAGNDVQNKTAEVILFHTT